MRCDFSSFPPAEAAAITGVSVDLQRDWRRRGILPKRDGHARFNIFDLAQLLIFRVLAERGIGPDRAKAISHMAATETAIAALRWVDAWDTETRAACPPGRSWSEYADDLCGAAVAEQTVSGAFIPALSLAHEAKLIWWCDDSASLTGSIDHALSALSMGDPRISGALIVIDLEAIADLLLSASNRPFAKITVPFGTTWHAE